MNVRSLRDLGKEWHADAAVLRRRGATEQAEVLETCAEELELRVDCWLNEVLPISEAAVESGYSEDHLRTLVRDGRVRAHRRNGTGRILIRRSDLPRRPAPAAPSEDLAVVESLAQELGA